MTVDAAGSPIRQVLRPGETVLWAGAQNVAAYALRGAWFLIPFSLLWGGFAIFWEISALLTRPLPFALFGVPFVVIGLYLIFGRIYVALREAEHTSYAITDRRVLIVTGAFGQRLLELDLRDLPTAQLEDLGRGLGTVTLGASISPFRAPPGWPTFGTYTRPAAFEMISEARRVFEILQDAKAEARRVPGS